MSGATVAEHVSVPVNYVPDFSAVAERVAAAARPGDVVVTMGAGDVTMLGPEILTALQVTANRERAGHGRSDAVTEPDGPTPVTRRRADDRRR